MSEQLKCNECDNVSFTYIDDLIVLNSVKPEFKKMILKRKQVFLHSNEAIPFNTSIIATIPTETNEPVYSTLYPYPMGAADFINTEIKQLLKDGTIRPSRLPFNSPTWVVHKKGLDADGNKKKRLLINFRKLKERTIADRYPSIPM